MQNIGIKHIMGIDMFCYIHEGGELVNGDIGVVKYIGDRTVLRLISICRMMNSDKEYVVHCTYN